MLGCGECDKGFVIMDEVKYLRLAERLKEPVPAERSERAREFVTDLAVGYEDKAWGAGLSFISDSEGKSPARIIRSNRSLSDDEEQRWTTNEVSVNIERMIYIFQPDGYDEMDADCIKALKNKWEQHNLGRDDINNAVIQGLLKAVSKVQFFSYSRRDKVSTQTQNFPDDLHFVQTRHLRAAGKIDCESNCLYDERKAFSG